MFLVKFLSKPTTSLVVGTTIAATSTFALGAVGFSLFQHARNKMTRAQRKKATEKANAAKAENKETKHQEGIKGFEFNRRMDEIRKKEREDEKRRDAEEKKIKADEKKKAKEAWEEERKKKEEERSKKEQERRKKEAEEKKMKEAEEESERKKKEAEEEEAPAAVTQAIPAATDTPTM